MKTTTFYQLRCALTRAALLAALCLCGNVSWAETCWVMTFLNADGETVEIPMTEVGSLVAVDDAYDFAVLSPSGEVLAEGVMKVYFGQKDLSPTGLPHTENIQVSRDVADRLTLIGIKGEVELYDSVGMLLAKTEAEGGETTLSVGHLPAGIYVVKCGRQTFKFKKK